ncbi:MAG: hypothetical protein INF03_13820 [Phenylobacterium sp.]|jgi:hypothetical protein|nr:hypothetical protein [Phenylobacterium sp.]
MQQGIETPTPGPLTWAEIVHEIESAEALEIRLGFARVQARRRAEELAKSATASADEIEAARAEAERAEAAEDRAIQASYRVDCIAWRHRPANARELHAKYVRLLRIYAGEREIDERFRDFAADLERFAVERDARVARLESYLDSAVQIMGDLHRWNMPEPGRRRQPAATEADPKAERKTSRRVKSAA